MTNFKCKLADCQKFKRIVDALKDLVSDVNIDTSATGISLQAMDSSHVALVSLMMNQEGFDYFKCEKPATIGVSIGNLSKVLKLANPEDSITLEFDEDPSCLTIIFESSTNSKSTTFNLNLLTLESENMGIPDTEYTSEITMNSNEFTKICKELGVISDTVGITTTLDYVEFSVTGDIGSGNIKINTSTGEIDQSGNPDAKGDKADVLVELSFALKYLTMFTKAAPLANEVSLQMSKDTPLVVQFEMSGLGNLFYYLAPKITDGEETDAS
ncbi:unnamed protein product [Moneuplotes crassus]|uniref:DNA sliding clamp PCNA n=1 Tax=Euplotes crassus TaxID=5936 RepID=A0AAD1XKU2_EUPCR|nr:unnamed protein product [Moneuplotes crassus]